MLAAYSLHINQDWHMQ